MARRFAIFLALLLFGTALSANNSSNSSNASNASNSSNASTKPSPKPKPKPKPVGKKLPPAKAMAKCRMSGKSLQQCRKELGIAAPATAKGRQKADVEAKAQALKGLKNALGDSMSNCTGSKDDCKKQAKEAMANLTGKVPTEAEFKAALRKAGAKKAADETKECIKKLGNKPKKEDVRKCVLSDAAKNAMASASGEDKSKFSDEDILKGFKKNMISTVAEELKTCLESAANKGAKNACYKKDDLKALIAGAEGKSVDKIKTADLRGYFQKSAREDAWAMLKSCNASAMDACKESAKQQLALALGKNESEITDRMLQMEASKAMTNELNDKMSSCLEDAGSDKAKQKRCRTAVIRESLMGARVGGSKKALTKADVAMALKNAAKQKAQEVSESCTKTRKECMALLKTQMAALGQTVSKVELERLNTAGAKEAAKNAAKACAEAKKEDPDATCEDPFEKFLAYQKKTKSSNPKKAKAEERRLKEELSISLKKDAMKVCFELATKAEADTCLADLKKESSSASDDLFKNVSSKVKAAKEKRAERKAALELVGERFHECMKEAQAGNQTEADACTEDLKSKISVAGIKGDAKALAKRFRAKMVRDAAKSCDSADRKACLQQMKEELTKTGVKARAFAAIRKIGAVKESAETWVACKEDSANTDADCDGLANETLREQTGAKGDIWAKMGDKVKRLAGNLLNGTETELRTLKLVSVEAETSGTECKDSASTAFVAKIADATEVKAAKVTAAEVINGGCELVFDKATYRAEVPTKELDTDAISKMSDNIASELANASLAGGRLLGADVRRLEAVSNTYADQAVEECAVGDTSCGTAPTPTPAPTASNIISGSTPVSCSSALLGLLTLLAGAFVV
eukprot:TRINITY_DN1444_c0_g1_i3.p1 TRINITY_DN1444_c0_g1~~TRINITY_DN1444_c0_g1_i3.p1  ORF type:complete len:869 (+),score=244.34 TRINITY_DN1444_c0_g1_i3:62-2668(+)